MEWGVERCDQIGRDGMRWDGMGCAEMGCSGCDGME